MSPAPIVVHCVSLTGGRRVTVKGQILGLARSDAGVVEFLRRVGIEDAEELLDELQWVEWRGGQAHGYDAA
ncbi:hypothetical protein ACIG3E_25045 [Streptomyces sp. NPDC053474]|uniref:hypothetical protein n=1 Tax=Streptomyces sp. NPDC053474 TaxID=3365704 RepID=UPI0037D585AF